MIMCMGFKEPRVQGMLAPLTFVGSGLLAVVSTRGCVRARAQGQGWVPMWVVAGRNGKRMGREVCKPFVTSDETTGLYALR